MNLPIVLFLFFLLLSSHSNADWVMPAERVQEGISLRAGPSSDTSFLGLLRVGERLEFVRSVPYWHEVRLTNGQPAFVSKSWSTIIPDAAPAPTGNYTMDVIDVGTGLSILIQGDDFVVLYDGGSNDDIVLGPGNRLVAYLSAVYPSLNRIDHLILSHPHRDHVELLPDIIANMEVRNVWDSGAINDICGYRAFIDAVVTRAPSTIPPVAITEPIQLDSQKIQAVVMELPGMLERSTLCTVIKLMTNQLR